MRRRERRNSRCLATVGVFLALAWCPLMARAQQVTFDFVGYPQPWVVPDSVTSITVDARGAQGGGNGSNPRAQGGRGGRVQTTHAVTPGETLMIRVGGRGGDVMGPNTAGPGGFNGGASGGIDNVDFNAPGAGGGGASDVRQGGDAPVNRAVVAGGGGGAECCEDANGGDGGGLIGATGGTTSGGGSDPGGGGAQSSGGAGGAGCNGNGSPGSLGQGGVGGNGNRAGGGGGGGYYGGGGGGGCLFGSGGGGGSSYSAGTGTVHAQGYQTGDGQVVITVPVGTLASRAAALARSLVPGPYLLGGKGWDWNDSRFVVTAEVESGYNYLFVDPVTGRSEVRFDMGIDCSGLAFWSYNKAAGATVYQPRPPQAPNPVFYEGADGQYRNNSGPVNETDLLPGDLLFFNYTHPPGLLVDHEAMYVGGDDVVEALNKQAGIKLSQKSTLRTMPGCAPGLTVPCFAGFRRRTPPIINFQVRALSPVDLVVTDPDGLTITARTLMVTERENLREVPGSLYYSEWEVGADSTRDTMVSSPALKLGDYLIGVVPKPGISPSDTYGLEVAAAGTIMTLAENTPVSDIPTLGYGIRFAGGGIIAFTPVGIDIKPGGFPNAVNPKSRGTIPVAILSARDFDAPRTVDRSSLTFGRKGDERSLAFCSDASDDVNGDGLPDLICTFYTQKTAFQTGDSQGILAGRTADGELIRGKDSVRIVP